MGLARVSFQSYQMIMTRTNREEYDGPCEGDCASVTQGIEHQVTVYPCLTGAWRPCTPSHSLSEADIVIGGSSRVAEVVEMPSSSDVGMQGEGPLAQDSENAETVPAREATSAQEQLESRAPPGDWDAGTQRRRGRRSISMLSNDTAADCWTSTYKRWRRSWTTSTSRPGSASPSWGSASRSWSRVASRAQAATQAVVFGTFAGEKLADEVIEVARLELESAA